MLFQASLYYVDEQGERHRHPGETRVLVAESAESAKHAAIEAGFDERLRSAGCVPEVELSEPQAEVLCAEDVQYVIEALRASYQSALIGEHRSDVRAKSIAALAARVAGASAVVLAKADD
jgi:hypothetical protein